MTKNNTTPTNGRKPLRTLMWLWVALGVGAAQASSTDRFNRYLWNRSNHVRGTGTIEKLPWYEWWYFKVVLPETGEAFYSVYGVVNPWDANRTLKGTRAYVGFGNFSKRLSLNEEFPISEFNASYDSTEVEVTQSNRMTDRHFEGRIVDPVHGEHAWNIDIEKKWGFNAMGWGLYIRKLTNIGWFPAQADASCSGWIMSDGRRSEFKNAPCYQDRNWGTSFPDWWAWRP